MTSWTRLFFKNFQILGDILGLAKRKENRKKFVLFVKSPFFGYNPETSIREKHLIESFRCLLRVRLSANQVRKVDHCSGSLFRKKVAMLSEIFQWNIAISIYLHILLEYEKPHRGISFWFYGICLWP